MDKTQVGGTRGTGAARCEGSELTRALQALGRPPEATEAGVNEKSGALAGLFDRTGSQTDLRESRT
jgi:hypothetical protein